MLVTQNHDATLTMQCQLMTMNRATRRRSMMPCHRHESHAVPMMHHYQFVHLPPDQARSAQLLCRWLHLRALLRQVQLPPVLERPALHQLVLVAQRHLEATLLHVAEGDSEVTLHPVVEEDSEEASMVASAEAEVARLQVLLLALAVAMQASLVALVRASHRISPLSLVHLLLVHAVPSHKPKRHLRCLVDKAA